jgi:hypothetical protein
MNWTGEKIRILRADLELTREEKAVQAMQLLNNKEYQAAIIMLEEIGDEGLIRSKSIKLLIDAYLGHCHMSAHSLYEQAKAIDEETKLIKREDKDIEEFDKIGRILGKTQKGTGQCVGYIHKAITMSAKYPLNIARQDDMDFYIGNLYVIDSLYLSQELYDSAKGIKIEFLRNLKILSDIEKINKLKMNSKQIISHYEKSYDRLKPMIKLLDRVVAWRIGKKF